MNALKTLLGFFIVLVGVAATCALPMQFAPVDRPTIMVIVIVTTYALAGPLLGIGEDGND